LNEPRAINTAGHVVGESREAGTWKQCDGPSVPYLWRDGQLIDLGLSANCGGVAYALNDSDEVVGDCGGGYYPYGAFLWIAGRLYSLNALIPSGSGWTITVPTEIN